MLSQFHACAQRTGNADEDANLEAAIVRSLKTCVHATPALNAQATQMRMQIWKQPLRPAWEREEAVKACRAFRRLSYNSSSGSSNSSGSSGSQRTGYKVERTQGLAAWQ
eukprot:scaffold179692_cov17-Tisochrysis_lutea.AAC.1